MYVYCIVYNKTIYIIHNNIYYMAQVNSGKIACCDWLLTGQDFSVMTAGIMKIVNAL